MTLPLNTRRPNLDAATFGASSAARILVEKINKSGNGALARSIAKAIVQYTSGLNEIIKMNDPPRTDIMNWWYEKHLGLVNRDELKKYDMTSFYNNLLTAKLRQFRDQGKLLEVLRDRDPDYEMIVRELQQMRLMEDRRD